MVHKRTNALTFWDKRGNQILNLVSERKDLTSEDLLWLDEDIKGLLEESGIEVDNSSEEFIQTKMLE